MGVQDQRAHIRAPAQQRLDSGVPRSPVDHAGARVAASSAGAGNAASLEDIFPEGGEHAGMPAKSPQPLKSPGADREPTVPAALCLYHSLHAVK